MSVGHIFSPLVVRAGTKYHLENLGGGDGEAKEPYSDGLSFPSSCFILVLMSVFGKKDYLKVQYVI